MYFYLLSLHVVTMYVRYTSTAFTFLPPMYYRCYNGWLRILIGSPNSTICNKLVTRANAYWHRRWSLYHLWSARQEHPLHHHHRHQQHGVRPYDLLHQLPIAQGSLHRHRVVNGYDAGITSQLPASKLVSHLPNDLTISTVNCSSPHTDAPRRISKPAHNSSIHRSRNKFQELLWRLFKKHQTILSEHVNKIYILV